jgi:hypothetical protein
LHVAERISAGEKQHGQGIAGKGRKREVAIRLGCRQRATHPIDAIAQVPRPGIYQMAEVRVDARPEAIKPAFLHQIDAELAEAEAGLEIAEMRPQDHVEPDVGVA